MNALVSELLYVKVKDICQKESNLCFPESECTCRQIVNIKILSPVLVVYLSNVNFYEVNILYIYT